MMEVQCLRWLGAAIIIAAFSLSIGSAQEIDWNNVTRQIQEKQAIEQAERDRLGRQLDAMMEASKQGRLTKEATKRPQTLTEFINSPESDRFIEQMRQNPPPRSWWPYGLMVTGGALLWVIWRGRRRIIGWVEDVIVAVGAGTIRIYRIVQTSIARIRKRIMDRAEE